MKKKILLLSDDPRATSGVATQARYLINGLVATGKYTFRCFGGALKHENYETVAVDENIIIKPVDNFGTVDMLRMALASEKPDILMLFTDPRFFYHIFETTDEIHQICPIIYNHLWDQCEFPPIFNKNFYESVDTFNCINRPTYEFLKKLYPQDTHPNRVNWTPHALPQEIFHILPEQEQKKVRSNMIKSTPDSEFVVGWVSRNARRKKPADLLWIWKIFLDELELKYGHRKATFVMHTDPFDQEGPNLLQVIDLFKLQKNVIISNDKTTFQDMNNFYNAIDVTISDSVAEGFGLTILESLYCGKPVIAPKTGGLERQVVDYRDGSENGIALPIELKTMVGSQTCPYIVEDHVTNETFAKAIMKMYEYGPEKRKEIGLKGQAYAHEEFSLPNLIKIWDNTLEDTMTNWKSRYKRWELIKL